MESATETAAVDPVGRAPVAAKVHARRLFLLFFVVLFCMGQSGDAVRVRAGICEDRKCLKLIPAKLEPATIAAYIYVAAPREGYLVFGIVCDGEERARSGPVDVTSNPAPVYQREYRNIGSGQCVAVARLTRPDGSLVTAQSLPVHVLARGE